MVYVYVWAPASKPSSIIENVCGHFWYHAFNNHYWLHETCVDLQAQEIAFVLCFWFLVFLLFNLLSFALCPPRNNSSHSTTLNFWDHVLIHTQVPVCGNTISRHHCTVFYQQPRPKKDLKIKHLTLVRYNVIFLTVTDKFICLLNWFFPVCVPALLIWYTEIFNCDRTHLTWFVSFHNFLSYKKILAHLSFVILYMWKHFH